MDYFELTQFKDIYLEDSFVLEINESTKEVTFVMEFVLKEFHPLFNIPNKNEQYCYKQGQIIFTHPTFVKWKNRKNKFYTDAKGERDLGNIDLFKVKNNTYFLEGDWGELKLNAKELKVKYFDN